MELKAIFIVVWAMIILGAVFITSRAVSGEQAAAADRAASKKTDGEVEADSFAAATAARPAPAGRPGGDEPSGMRRRGAAPSTRRGKPGMTVEEVERKEEPLDRSRFHVQPQLAVISDSGALSLLPCYRCACIAIRWDGVLRC
eukprot:PLAT13372.1.p1 GENE.PLAT13372.1~~PLAT13372.1.p1  ORF type:complete len:143 (-),score=23.50 PLAT13372.1:64-492(-)